MAPRWSLSLGLALTGDFLWVNPLAALACVVLFVSASETSNSIVLAFSTVKIDSADDGRPRHARRADPRGPKGVTSRPSKGVSRIRR